MDRIVLYLRTPLASLGVDHLPADLMVLEGTLVEQTASCVKADIERMLDDRGRERVTEVVTLIIPWEKIDHILVLD